VGAKSLINTKAHSYILKVKKKFKIDTNLPEEFLRIAYECISNSASLFYSKDTRTEDGINNIFVVYNQSRE